MRTKRWSKVKLTAVALGARSLERHVWLEARDDGQIVVVPRRELAGREAHDAP